MKLLSSLIPRLIYDISVSITEFSLVGKQYILLQNPNNKLEQMLSAGKILKISLPEILNSMSLFHFDSAFNSIIADDEREDILDQWRMSSRLAR